MKKIMMVTAIAVSLSVLVSIIAVSPLFAAQATKTTPTTKQQTQPATGQKPPSPTIKKPTGQIPVYAPKQKFWGLELDHCVVGVLNPCSNSAINVKQAAPFVGTCYYKVKTITVNDITESDANAWGKGKSYLVGAYLNPTNNQKEETRKLPKFTWADVQQWKSAGQGSAPKIWTERFDFIWYPTKEHLGQNLFVFWADKNKEIEEYDGGDNNVCYGVINLIP